MLRAPSPAEAPEAAESTATNADPFDEIDFGSFFDDYLDPGYKSPASEDIEKPSFETFLSSPVTLSEHLRTQLALVVLPRSVREAAEAIVGNLDDNGYLTQTLEELAELYGCSREQVRWRESRALKAAGLLLAQRRSTSEIGDGDTAHRPKPTRRLVF